MYNHIWTREYYVVDSSCLYCKTCNMWYAEYLENNCPPCQ